MALWKRGRRYWTYFSVNGVQLRRPLCPEGSTRATTNWQEALRLEKEMIRAAVEGELAPRDPSVKLFAAIDDYLEAKKATANSERTIEFDRERLTSAVKRVALLSNERSRAVKFEIGAGKVEVTSSSSEFGEAHEQLPVDYTGPALTISFNAQYVLDFLNVVETDVVTLSLKDEVSQAVMKPIGADGYDYTYVIMPMRI